MNFFDALDASMTKNNSLVCVGLDPDLDKMPEQFRNLERPLFEFNKFVIDVTSTHVCAYKPNSAFYEALGEDGISQLKQTCDYLNQHYQNIPILLDFKRGDIGSTNEKYAQFAFDHLGVDAITVQAYQGIETLNPFFEYTDKGIFVWVRASNPESSEFQDIEINGTKLFEIVAKSVASKQVTSPNVSLVVGATFPDELATIRELIGDAPILVPGVGAQGGDVEAVLKAGLNSQGKGLIINSSRGIIYTENPGESADTLKNQINQFRG